MQLAAIARNHPANFTGCPRNPLNKPPPPKVNYWDERSRKRREMKEAAQARAESANPAMILTTQSRAHSPPVSAFHAPTLAQDHPSPPNPRQYSTAASNSTSNPIEPNITSNISETLHKDYM
ncbi:hypothetical protein TNCV_3944391 [Trichonephila clavipes]|nr:hypothetical protein TNCV_3944391 [Trichonephila clavipes]